MTVCLLRNHTGTLGLYVRPTSVAFLEVRIHRSSPPAASQLVALQRGDGGFNEHPLCAHFKRAARYHSTAKMGRSTSQKAPDKSLDTKESVTIDIDMWDNSHTTVAEHARDLAEWIPKQDARYLPMIEEGVAFIKDKTVCFSDNHVDSLCYDTLTKGTVLRYLMLLSETRRGLCYSLWGLCDQPGLPGCLVRVARHWGTPVYRSSSLKIFRYTTYVRRRPPPRRQIAT